MLKVYVLHSLWHAHAVTPATGQWCSGQIGAILQSVVLSDGRRHDSATVDLLLQNAADHIVNLIEVRAVQWPVLWTGEVGYLSWKQCNSLLGMFINKMTSCVMYMRRA